MTEEEFRKQIAENPNEWLTYLAFADWLEENTKSNAISDALRWMGTNEKRPQLTRLEPNPWLWTRRTGESSIIAIPQLVPHTDLPDDVADRMGIPKHGEIYNEVGMARFRSWDDAVIALSRAIDPDLMDPPKKIDFDIGNTVDPDSGLVNPAPFPKDWEKHFK